METIVTIFIYLMTHTGLGLPSMIEIIHEDWTGYIWNFFVVYGFTYTGTVLGLVSRRASGFAIKKLYVLFLNIYNNWRSL